MESVREGRKMMISSISSHILSSHPSSSERVFHIIISLPLPCSTSTHLLSLFLCYSLHSSCPRHGLICTPQRGGGGKEEVIDEKVKEYFATVTEMKRERETLGCKYWHLWCTSTFIFHRISLHSSSVWYHSFSLSLTKWEMEMVKERESEPTQESVPTAFIKLIMIKMREESRKGLCFTNKDGTGMGCACGSSSSHSDTIHQKWTFITLTKSHYGQHVHYGSRRKKQ